MNLHRCLLASFFWATVTSYAGEIDVISKSVVFLRDKHPVTETINGVTYEDWIRNPTSGAFVPKLSVTTGSGFIVIDDGICFLVSAKHVASVMTSNCDVIMGGDKEEPWQFTLAELTGQANQLNWVNDPVADVAIYPLPTITKAGEKAFAGRAFPLSLLCTNQDIPSRDDFVTVLGFPLGLGAEGQFIPLARETRTASGMLKDGGGAFFLLQDPSTSGFSGGPLVQAGDARVVPNGSSIAVVTGGTRCWGFVSATYSDETGGKMCRIEPAFYAANLIKSWMAANRVFPPPIQN